MTRHDQRLSGSSDRLDRREERRDARDQRSSFERGELKARTRYDQDATFTGDSHGQDRRNRIASGFRRGVDRDERFSRPGVSTAERHGYGATHVPDQPRQIEDDDFEGHRRGLRSSHGFNEPSRSSRDSNIPLSIPYTTPASEFLYGTSVITAALQARTRKMYKLYIYEGENRQAVTRDDSIRKMARKAGVEVLGVQGEWQRLMDKMSSGRPHNVGIPVRHASPASADNLASLGLCPRSVTLATTSCRRLRPDGLTSALLRSVTRPSVQRGADGQRN